MEVLQTSALPLGDSAGSAWERRIALEGSAVNGVGWENGEVRAVAGSRGGWLWCGVEETGQLPDEVWLRRLPRRDFRFAMGLAGGNAGEFLRWGKGSGEVLAERSKLLRESAEHYVLGVEQPEVAAAVSWLGEVTGRRFADWRAAAEGIESDWVVLGRDGDGEFRLRGGVVCFPSGWSLPEKAGMTVAEVHGPVPELEGSLGRGIRTFLNRLGAGSVWCRDNWGVSAQAERDQHPRHGRAGLGPEATLEAAWLRLEEQMFAGLPGGLVVFAIRVSTHRLDALSAIPGVAEGLARALRTMSSGVADYKGLTASRNGLASQLEQVADGRLDP